jgi:hypothetical protein
LVVLTVDSTGTVVQEQLLPPYPPDFAGVVVASHPTGKTLTRPLPFGQEYWVIQSSDGSYATVITSEYAITHRDLDGTLRRRITRELRGQPLSSAEQAEGERELADLRRLVDRAGGSLPDVRLPDRKPVVDQIWFDQEDRLWVKLNAQTADGDAQADVYARTGELSFHAQWPADVDLRYGAIRGATAWGVRTGVLDEHILVRLVFQ